MPRRMFAKLLFAIISVALLSAQVSAQGGWRQWKIFLVDGTSIEASPLQLRADGRLTGSMDPKETGFDRAKIDYLAASTKQLPPAPTGKFNQDLVITLDGKRTLGKITFKSLKFSEGTIVQNRKELNLENVAYIKFAHPKSTKNKKPAP